jgi:hypothetical protein
MSQYTVIPWVEGLMTMMRGNNKRDDRGTKKRKWEGKNTSR